MAFLFGLIDTTAKESTAAKRRCGGCQAEGPRGPEDRERSLLSLPRGGAKVDVIGSWVVSSLNRRHRMIL